MGEFALIERFFSDVGVRRADVQLGVGDDGAALIAPPGMALIAVCDTLVEGRHFPASSSPASIGHRALAVNLSDIAAMGAEPAWALLALTLPRAEAGWLAKFSAGFTAAARAANVALVGGDTTRGPLAVTVTLLGFAPPDKLLRRCGGAAGDIVFVTGTPGDAARGLELCMGAASVGDGAAALRRRFEFPAARLALGCGLRGLASACIDVSDGLAGDAGKLAIASGCGVRLDVDQLPLSAALLADVGRERAIGYALTGGDDYELCFTVPASQLQRLEQHLPAQQHGYKRIGQLTRESGVLVQRLGQKIELPVTGFDHFA